MQFVDSARNLNFEIDYSSRHEKDYVKNWLQGADGSWGSVDIGRETDTRTARLRVRDSNENIIDLETFILDKASGITQKLEVKFEEGEEVFGCEIDYSENLFIYITSAPRYKYESLDFGSLEFEILLDKESEPTFLEAPAGHSWESMPWDFSVSRENLENFSTVVSYAGEVFSSFDESRAKVVKASFLLDRSQCVWLKRTLLDLRVGTVTIENTYFDLTNSSPIDQNVSFKIRDYQERREAVNLYRVNAELLINV